MAQIKAILFDMDGVLIEAKEWHYETLNKALALFGYEISRFDHLSSYDGLPTRYKLKKLSIEKGLPKALHGFINEMKQQYTVSMIHTLCRPYFKHEFALSRLVSEGYRLAVCSNSVRISVELMMSYAKLDKYFEFMLSNEDIAKAKPDPDIYLTAMEKMKLKPEECLILEDNENGILAARASGAHLMIVESVDDVFYDNIRAFITDIEEGVSL